MRLGIIFWNSSGLPIDCLPNSSTKEPQARRTGQTQVDRHGNSTWKRRTYFREMQRPRIAWTQESRLPRNSKESYWSTDPSATDWIIPCSQKECLEPETSGWILKRRRKPPWMPLPNRNFRSLTTLKLWWRWRESNPKYHALKPQ